MSEEPLIGPNSFERERKLTPEDVQLFDGSPLYHALLETDEAGVANQDDVQKANDELREIISQNPEVAFSCEGNTLEEAREKLRGVSV